MAEITKLSKAPVIEAVFRFMADASPKWEAAPVKGFIRESFPEFSVLQEQRVVEQNFEFSQGKIEKSESTLYPVTAFIAHRPDNSSAIQVRKDGFSFSKLAPYANWECFCAEALAGWETFRGYFGIELAHFAVVRFINKISVETERLDLDAYFSPAPDVPKGCGWDFISFDEHHIYMTPEKDCVVDSRLSQESAPGVISFILDSSVRPTKAGLAPEEISAILPRLRELKNAAFFSKLTDTALIPYR